MYFYLNCFWTVAMCPRVRSKETLIFFSNWSFSEHVHVSVCPLKTDTDNIQNVAMCIFSFSAQCFYMGLTHDSQLINFLVKRIVSCNFYYSPISAPSQKIHLSIGFPSVDRWCFWQKRNLLTGGFFGWFRLGPEATVITVWKMAVCKWGVSKRGILKWTSEVGFNSFMTKSH